MQNECKTNRKLEINNEAINYFSTPKLLIPDINDLSIGKYVDKAN